MSSKKTNILYYFSCEGETEQWYLDWLQKRIYNEGKAKHNVVIDKKVEKNPVRRVKQLSPLGHIDIVHLYDYEGNDEASIKNFKNVIDLLKEAEKLGKQIKYNMGYSNLTFELWIILHKMDCNALLNQRTQYLQYINKAYNKKFKNLDEYKNKDNFNQILNNLTIDNVKDAIKRSEKIMKINNQNGYKLQHYKGYSYFRENPSLTIYKAIKNILKDCGLL